MSKSFIDFYLNTPQTNFLHSSCSLLLSNQTLYTFTQYLCSPYSSNWRCVLHRHDTDTNNYIQSLLFSKIIIGVSVGIHICASKLNTILTPSPHFRNSFTKCRKEETKPNFYYKLHLYECIVEYSGLKYKQKKFDQATST